MLLEFTVQNYKSFQERAVFSMMPLPRLTDLEYSLLKEEISSKKNICALSSAVIYGPNASGKTNLISAMDTFKTLVLKGNIKNSNSNYQNFASGHLELIPFFNNEGNQPICFHIKFFDCGKIISYGFSLDIGQFMQSDYSRSVVEEILEINQEKIFERTGNKLLVYCPKQFQSLMNEGMTQNTFDNGIAIAANGLNPQELFLVNGFKNIFSQSITKQITDWLDNKLIVCCQADKIVYSKNSEGNNQLIDDTLNEAAKIFGINSNSLQFLTPKDSAESRLFSVIDKARILIPAEIFESYGTLRFANEFPLVIATLINGGVLIVDEFDASLHPMALMSIINIFHNDSINKRHAQLIFNTHNPIYLNSNLFRRDEIKFVERDDETYASTLYSLSDFGTSGKDAVRKGEDYMKHYFVSRYGAIKNIDFSPVFERIMAEVPEE